MSWAILLQPSFRAQQPKSLGLRLLLQHNTTSTILNVHPLIHREVSSGSQDLLEDEENPYEEPIGQAIQKLEGEVSSTKAINKM